MRVVVVAALREEASAVWRRLPACAPGEKGAGWKPALHVTGDGPVRAERGAAAILNDAEALIGIGVAGGVDASLRRGDMIVAKTIIDEDGALHDCDATLIAAAVDCGATPVRIASTRVMLRDKSGVNAAAVDMESAAWQRAASAKNIRFVAVRVILDPAGVALPEFLLRCTREDGSVSRGRVVVYALLHPWVMPQLMRMASQMRDASRRLAAFMERLLARIGATAYDPG